MRKIIFLLLFSAIINGVFAQESPWPKTLLWKISGNNLSQPSFLFGTMHLQDKRLFYFGDSLYHYLERVDGYALEIDLQEFMDSVMQKAIEEGANEAMDDEKVKPVKEKKMIDSLLQNIKQYKDKSSRKALERIRQRKIKKLLSENQMPTIMDAHLFSIAKRQGKWVGGIEDVQDQISVIDELGTDIDSNELTTSDSKLKSVLDEMISIYLDEDLNRIESYSAERHSSRFEELVFTRRNKKMSRRMDSLMSIRTMFFAVGAAHLPGDSGVIRLLRGLGYTLEPVFSTQKIDPDKYSSGLTQFPWAKVTDEKNTYSIEMPGQPTDMDVFGELFRMKLYLDVTTLTYYMCGSTLSQKTTDPEEMVNLFSKRMKDAKVENKKRIEKDGAKGMEATLFSEGIYYKVQFYIKNNIVYLLMAGGENKSVLNSSDLKRYFQSLVINDKKGMQTEGEKEWKVFALDEKAFTIMLPGAPKQNKAIEKNADGTTWKFSVYDYNDLSSGVYYMVQIRDLVPGYYLTGDSAYFELVKENFKEAFKNVLRDEMIKVQGFPALRYDGNAGNDGIAFATLNINRGNRVYTLMAGSANGINDPSIERFLRSFTATDYKQANWKKQSSPDGSFYTLAPFEITIKEEEKSDDEDKMDVNADEKKNNYISFNPYEVISYQVFKEALPKYYWANDDSSFFAQYAGAYKGYTDSVLSKKLVTNGKLKAGEWVIRMPDNNNLKKVRVILNGDTVFTLVSFIASQYIDRKDHQQFFDEFRVMKENAANTAFKSKAADIFRDLQSKDSAIFTGASAAVSTAAFTKKDLPLLHENLIRSFLDDTSHYYNTRSRIKAALDGIADSSTVEFIRKNFDNLSGERATLKFDLLDVLARYKTDYSYSVLKDLLLKHTPSQKMDDDDLSYRITDSIELATKLFPEILSLSNNTLFAERIMSISKELLDSNAITLSMLKPYEPAFLHTADTSLVSLKKTTGEDYGYGYLDMLGLLAKFNDEKTNAMLQQYLLLNDLTIKQQVVIDMLKNGQVVDQKQIEKLAADKAFRKDIYDALAEIKKDNLFPAKYRTQRYMAESAMYYYSSDDEEPSEIVFVSDKTAEFNGKKQRFFLFKVVFDYGDGEKSQYLGIAGPYSSDSKNIETDNDATGLYWEEEFDSKKVDAFFKKYMTTLNERAKKQD